jgi:hypothetical protein
MAARLLLPGFGGQYVTETLDANSTTGADTLDASRCAQLAVQIKHISGTPSGSVQLQVTYDGTNWANYADAIAVTTDGTIVLYDTTDGPFGLMRVSESIAAGSVKVYITGFELQTIP